MANPDTPDPHLIRPLLAWHRYRLVASAVVALSGVGLAIAWGWPAGFTVALLAVVTVADATYRRSDPRPADAAQSVLVDVAVLGAMGLVSQLPAPGVGMPFAYLVTAALLFAPRPVAVRLIAYAAIASAAVLLVPAVYDLPQWPGGKSAVLTLVPYGLFLGFIVAVVHTSSGSREALDRALQRADSAGRAKLQFLRNISHEIRTPMNGIMGMAELMGDERLTPRQRDQLDVIRTSSQTLLVLINDLLDLSWLETDEAIVEEMPFRVRDTIADVLSARRELALDKGIRVDWEVSPSVPDVIVSDPGRFRQVLDALVSNAVKFTAEGSVHVGLDVGAAGSGDLELRTRVEDTGPGIPPEVQRRLFQAFEQADESLTRRSGGAGVGLAIAARIVERLGGRLTVDSRPGSGSTFSFTVRAGLPGPDAERPIRTPPLWAVPTLLVTDGPAGGSVERALAGAGIPLLVARGADEAVASLRRPSIERGFGLVVIDVPGDLATVKEIAERAGTGDARFVVITASGQRGDGARCRRLGVSGYLSKPVQPDELIDALRAVVALPAGDVSTLITRHSLRESRRVRRILVAEDSPTNRTIVVGMLEKRGYEVATACDGLDAVEVWESGRPDLILMDVQMPGMDGLAATQEIRRRESQGGGRTTIVALTAHALRGDRDRCAAAGMDGYLTKPIRPADLYAAIEAATPQPGPATSTPDGDRPVIFDEPAALEMTGGDAFLLADVIDHFLKSMPGQRAELAAAITQSDWAPARSKAHQFKGELGSICAAASYVAARDLDAAAKARDGEQTGRLWAVLDDELSRLEPVLAAFVSAHQTSNR